MKRMLVHCTGCGETWESSPRLVGALCGKGQVRPATEAEAADYSGAEPQCYCESGSWSYVECEEH